MVALLWVVHSAGIIVPAALPQWMRDFAQQHFPACFEADMHEEMANLALYWSLGLFKSQHAAIVRKALKFHRNLVSQTLHAGQGPAALKCIRAMNQIIRVSIRWRYNAGQGIASKAISYIDVLDGFDNLIVAKTDKMSARERESLPAESKLGIARREKAQRRAAAKTEAEAKKAKEAAEEAAAQNAALAAAIERALAKREAILAAEEKARKAAAERRAAEAAANKERESRFKAAAQYACYEPGFMFKDAATRKRDAEAFAHQAKIAAELDAQTAANRAQRAAIRADFERFVAARDAKIAAAKLEQDAPADAEVAEPAPKATVEASIRQAPIDRFDAQAAKESAAHARVLAAALVDAIRWVEEGRRVMERVWAFEEKEWALNRVNPDAWHDM